MLVFLLHLFVICSLSILTRITFSIFKRLKEETSIFNEIIGSLNIRVSKLSQDNKILIIQLEAEKQNVKVEKESADYWYDKFADYLSTLFTN